MSRNMFHGPLRKCVENPRYFTDETQKAIYLTGSHTWAVFQDTIEPNGTVSTFDYEAYLDFMQKHNHNFLRFWCRENALGGPFGGVTVPMAYLQVDAGSDNIPKYDLTKLNPAYFERLRARVKQAGEKGIYTAIMLFEGWNVDTRAGNVWHGHPYHRDNNINGIDANPPNSFLTVALSGENDINPFMPNEHIIVHTLANPAITALQKAYVKKVIETVNDLDNVLYEICNEGLRWSRYWQYEMIDFIRQTESSMPKQHPVWMSHLVPAQNESLLVSRADAISPGVESTDADYCIDPPAGDGDKVIIVDTDHLGGIWGTQQWVWKSFLRGLNPIFMDTYMRKEMDADSKNGALQTLFGRTQYALPQDWQGDVRTAMGQTRRLSQRIDLTHMRPMGQLSSTRYCLANPGEEYLVYQPESGQFKLKLYGAKGPFSVEWYIPKMDKTLKGPSFEGGTAIDFSPPEYGEIVLYLKKLV